MCQRRASRQKHRTLRTHHCRWIERGKLKATTDGSTFQIALADLDHFLAPMSEVDSQGEILW